MKWLLSLVLLTLAFIAVAFFLDKHVVAGYLWMSMGMALVALVFFLIIYLNRNKDSKKVVGSYIVAVGLKFILTMLLVVLYVVIFGLEQRIDFVVFFIAFGLYSLVLYTGAYFNK